MVSANMSRKQIAHGKPVTVGNVDIKTHWMPHRGPQAKMGNAVLIHTLEI